LLFPQSHSAARARPCRRDESASTRVFDALLPGDDTGM
jgi:hypothetical protein